MNSLEIAAVCGLIVLGSIWAAYDLYDKRMFQEWKDNIHTQNKLLTDAMREVMFEDYYLIKITMGRTGRPDIMWELMWDPYIKFHEDWESYKESNYSPNRGTLVKKPDRIVWRESKLYKTEEEAFRGLDNLKTIQASTAQTFGAE